MTRVATIRTALDAAGTVAAAVRPDNTPEIDVRVEEGDDGPDVAVATVERETTGGLRTTVDDYVVNLRVASDVVRIARLHAESNPGRTDAGRENTDADHDRTDADNDHTDADHDDTRS